MPREDTSMSGGGPQSNGEDSLPGGLSPAGLDFLKFFGFATVAGLFLAGYSYVDTLYDRFGLALHEVGIGYLETIEFSAFLLGDDAVVFAAIFVIVTFSAVVAWVRYVFGNFGFYLAVVILSLLLAYLAVLRGSAMANGYANELIVGDKGRRAYCRLKPEADISSEFRKSFVRVTKEHRVRKFKETQDMMYLFIVSAPDEEPNDGQSLSIQKALLSHCRVVSGGSVSVH